MRRMILWILTIMFAGNIAHGETRKKVEEYEPQLLTKVYVLATIDEHELHKFSIYTPTNGVVTSLGHNEVESPSISPDGNWVVFLKDEQITFAKTGLQAQDGNPADADPNFILPAHIRSYPGDTILTMTKRKSQEEWGRTSRGKSKFDALIEHMELSTTTISEAALPNS